VNRSAVLGDENTGHLMRSQQGQIGAGSGTVRRQRAEAGRYSYDGDAMNAYAKK